MSPDRHFNPNPSGKHFMGTFPAPQSLRSNKHVVMAALAVLVGLAAGFGALGFRYLAQLFQLMAYGSQGNLLEIIESIPWYIKTWYPALGGHPGEFRAILFQPDRHQSVVAKDTATAKVIAVHPDDSLFTALKKITAKDFSILPVVSTENPDRLLGIVTQRDIIGAYNSALIKKPLDL